MYDVIFYSDNIGYEPTAEFISELRQKSYTDKNARINFNKIVAYIDILCENGTRVGEPVVKHLDGDIWELRPLNNRILFAYYKDKLLRKCIGSAKCDSPRLTNAARLRAGYSRSARQSSRCTFVPCW